MAQAIFFNITLLILHCVYKILKCNAMQCTAAKYAHHLAKFSSLHLIHVLKNNVDKGSLRSTPPSEGK